MRLRYTSVEKGNSKVIEFELYQFENSKKIYKEMENDIIEGGTVAPEIRGTGTSDPTQAKAMKLLSNPHMVEMKRRIDAIESVIKTLPDNKYQLLKEKYFIISMKL